MRLLLNIGVGVGLLGLALPATIEAQSAPVTSGYLVETSRSLPWLALATPTDTWLVQLDTGCPMQAGMNVQVVGQPDQPDAEVQTLDGLTSCSVAVSEYGDHQGCVLNPRVPVCDVRYNAVP